MRRDDQARFTACWHSDAGRVAAYATRHVGSQEAQEVVAETFLQAWRRWDSVPDAALPWLIGTARKVIGNHRRSERRRLALKERMHFLDEVAQAAPEAGMVSEERLEALRLLAALPDDQREALLLVAWDGLDTEAAATVLNVRPATVRTRMHRARLALETAQRDCVLVSTEGP
jgi:RNA polymerase sigma factor (sigma-70 family)